MLQISKEDVKFPCRPPPDVAMGKKYLVSCSISYQQVVLFAFGDV